MGVGIERVTTPVGDPAWLVQGYDDVRALLHERRLGRSHPDPANAPRFSRSAIFGGPMGDDPAAEAANHARMRKLLAPSFSARQMDRLRPRVRDIVAEMVGGLLGRTPPVDFHEAISFPLPALVICELLGVPFADRAEFRRWSDDAAHKTDEERSRAGLLALWEYMRELVRRKTAEPGEDVVSDLVRAAERDGADSPDGVAMLAAGLLFAGHETTVAAIDRGLVLLLTHPDQWAALRRDPALVPGAVEETLRCELPATVTAGADAGGLPRYAAADVDIHGVTVPAGDLVLLGLHTANLDHGHFPRPERFDSTRAPNPHLTFGHGPRFCLGAPLARMELTELFTALASRCPDIGLAVGVDELRYRDELLVGGLAELPVTWPQRRAAGTALDG